MPQLPTRFIAATAAVGAVDGYLERQDATWAFRQPTGTPIPASNRSTDWKKGWGTYAEVGGVVLGAVLNGRARTPSQADLALGLISASAALLGRKAGIYGAEMQETPRPGAYSGAGQPPAGQAQVFAPHSAAPYFLSGLKANQATATALQAAV